MKPEEARFQEAHSFIKETGRWGDFLAWRLKDRSGKCPRCGSVGPLDRACGRHELDVQRVPVIPRTTT